MDPIDIEILRCLRENARMTASLVASRVNLSVSAVTERIHRMENDGVIEQYTLLLNHEKIGKATRAYMEVTLSSSEHSDAFCQRVLAMKPILRCDYLSGEFDFLLLAQTADVEALSRLHDAVKRIEGVRSIRLRLVLKTAKQCMTALPGEGSDE